MMRRFFLMYHGHSVNPESPHEYFFHMTGGGRKNEACTFRRNRFMSRGENDLPELPMAAGLAKGETSRN
jgi:hypothetical protein